MSYHADERCCNAGELVSERCVGLCCIPQVKSAIYDMTVPLTTREPLDGEVNGVDYNFVRQNFYVFLSAIYVFQHFQHVSNFCVSESLYMCVSKSILYHTC